MAQQGIATGITTSATAVGLRALAARVSTLARVFWFPFPLLPPLYYLWEQ